MGTNNQPINVDLSKLDALQCHCGNYTWGKIHLIKRVPALLSPSGKDLIVFQEVGVVCCGCGEFSKTEEVAAALSKGITMLEGKFEGEIKED